MFRSFDGASLLKIHGVGEYTAGAIASIAFDEPVENHRIFAQNLLSDAAQDVTNLVTVAGNSLTVCGNMVLQIAMPEDPEKGIPAIVLQVV